jgi:hypothetical protein
MDSLSTEWSYKGSVVRNKPVARMVAVTDLWKAVGSPTPFRPDKWFKSDLAQEKLEGIVLITGKEIRDEKEKIVGIPGVLEVVRGGRYSQGTFVSYDLAIDYTKLLSNELHWWFTCVLPSSSDTAKETEETKSPAETGQILALPFGSEDVPSSIRITPDGRISVYDGIGYTTGQKNPHDAWKRIVEPYPEVLAKCENFQFPGKGQRETPVATLQVFLEILVLLPGRVAAQVREKAVKTLVRAMQGDLSLVEEILDRIHSSQDLINLENIVKLRRERAYGSSLPSGTLSNPLRADQITAEIKNGYGWKNNVEEMTDLLVQLATYVGDMVISRDSPHRSYGTTKAKSRMIPLVLRRLKDFHVLHVYHFGSDYTDDEKVVDIFKSKAYPELAYRDFNSKGIKLVVTHLVSPGGISDSGVQRLKECQRDLDIQYSGAIKLDAMRLDELVWGEMFPLIQERYRDDSGKFSQHHLNRTVTSTCKKLCSRVYIPPKALKPKQTDPNQLSLLGELFHSS